MNNSNRNGAKGGKGGKQLQKKKKKEAKQIGHRMERMAPPGGRTTINLGGFGDDHGGDAGSSVDSPSSTDVHVPRYSDGQQDSARGRGNASNNQQKLAPAMERLNLGRPKTSAPDRVINYGGEGHEYTSYNPYSTKGNVITVDDLPTEGLMITTPRGLPLKDCVNATRREMDTAATRWKASDQTRVGGNAAKSVRQLRESTGASTAADVSPGPNEFGSGARRIQPPGGNSTFKF